VTHATPPDLSTDEGRAAWRAELRAVAFWPRILGVSLIFGSGLVIVWNRFFAHAPNRDAISASYVVLAVGWLLFAIALLIRSRYQRRRLSDS
jgi:hypothetical protein